MDADVTAGVMGDKMRIGKILIVIVIVAIFAYLIFSLTSVGGSSQSVSFSGAIGKEAPDFSLQSIDGTTVKLSDYQGKVVVLFFSEGAMCYPACWDQIAALASDKRFNNENVVAFAVVVDPKGTWEEIARKVPQLSNAEILFDTTKSVSSTYDVLSLPSSMHKGSTPGHTYVVVDKNGVIQYALDDPTMAIRNDEIASVVEGLTSG